MPACVAFENVSRRFILRHQRPRSFQDAFVSRFKRRDGQREEFWALRDVSFSLEQGETLGLIGENGSGKSTTLKLISRILQPTAGRVQVHGSVSALIELGAGFHPDLTGRENIYLNGSILGFSRKEMNRKFRQILQFSELERFIDTPVKHYSSGMYARLGFSVAVHVEPDILLVDEVLSVGDEAFQEKCFRRIMEMSRSGVAILFVSHSLGLVQTICKRVILLHEGRMVHEGGANKSVSAYHTILMEEAEEKRRAAEAAQQDKEGAAVVENDPSAPPETWKVGPGQRWGSREIEFTRVCICNSQGEERSEFRCGDELVVTMEYRARERVERPVFGISINREDNVYVWGITTKHSGDDPSCVVGEGVMEYRVELPLLSGTFLLSTVCYDSYIVHPYDHHERLYSFHVRTDDPPAEIGGLIRVEGAWTHHPGQSLAVRQSATSRSPAVVS